MNNNEGIKIKSQPQPDGGEGDSKWQGMIGNGDAEESYSENAGRYTKIMLGGLESGRVCNTRRSPLSIVWQRNVDMALAHGKSIGLPQEIPNVFCANRTGISARILERVWEVSQPVGRSFSED